MFAAGGYHLPLLCALAAISAGAGSFFNPAMTALKPLLVPADRRQAANATLSMLQTGSSVAGPALGGLTVAAFGAPAGFAVNAASFLASMVAALLVRAHAERGPRDSMLRELGEGWREISKHDWLIGGLIGAALALRFKPRHLLRAGWLTLLLMPLWALAYVWPAELLAVMAGAVAGYAGLIFFGVAWETAIQDDVPHRVLGRVASWDYLTSFIAMPIGNAMAGPLSDAYGMNKVLTACAAVLLLSAVAQLLIPGGRRLTRAEAAPVRRPPELAGT